MAGAAPALAWRVEVQCWSRGALLRPEAAATAEGKGKGDAGWSQYWLLPGTTEMVRSAGMSHRNVIQNFAKEKNVDRVLQVKLPGWIKEPNPWETLLSRSGNLTLHVLDDGSLHVSCMNRRKGNKPPTVNGVAAKPGNDTTPVPSGARISVVGSTRDREIVAVAERVPVPYIASITGLSAKDKAAVVTAARKCPGVQVLSSSGPKRRAVDEHGQAPEGAPTITITPGNPKIASAKMLQALVDNVPLVQDKWLLAAASAQVKGLPFPDPRNEVYAPNTERMQQAASLSNPVVDHRLSAAARSQVGSQGFSDGMPRSVYLANDQVEVSYAPKPRRRSLFKDVTFVITEAQVQLLEPILRAAGAKVEILSTYKEAAAAEFIESDLYARIEAGERVVALRPSGVAQVSRDIERLLEGLPAITNAEVSTHILCAQGLDFSGPLVGDILAQAERARKDAKRSGSASPAHGAKNSAAARFDLFSEEEDQVVDENDSDEAEAPTRGTRKRVKTERPQVVGTNPDNAGSGAKAAQPADKLGANDAGPGGGLTLASILGGDDEALPRRSRKRRLGRGHAGGAQADPGMGIDDDEADGDDDDNNEEKDKGDDDFAEDKDGDSDDSGTGPSARASKRPKRSPTTRSARVKREQPQAVGEAPEGASDDGRDEDDEDDGPFGPSSSAKPRGRDSSLTRKSAQKEQPRSQQREQSSQRSGRSSARLKTEPTQNSSQNSRSSRSVHWGSSGTLTGAAGQPPLGSQKSGDVRRIRKGRVYFRKPRVRRAAEERPQRESFILIRPHAYRS